MMEANEIKTILFISVGGSYQPIVKAINELKPDYTVFICTGKDPATGRAGSDIQINGKGNCIKADNRDEKPSLPCIPKQTTLDETAYQLVTTVSDDLDQIYLDCTQTIKDISQQHPNAELYADYTGGTKSMSSGLVMAALEFPDIELQLVTGNRSDLVKVQDGAESAAPANIEQVRFQRMITPYYQCWNRYAYSEAVEGVKTLKSPRQRELRAQYNCFKELSQAFAAWDNFNHLEALQILKRYAPNLPDHLKQYIPLAQRLNDNNARKQEAAKLYDLYLNAQRRASQGRYDDAVARIYRLIEWSAQWLLKACEIDTGNLKTQQFEGVLELTANRDGQYQVGLMQAWQLVKCKTSGAASEFFASEENNLLNHIKTRNQSILAHGYQPVCSDEWDKFNRFLENTLILMLLSETAETGIKVLPVQLPNSY